MLQIGFHLCTFKSVSVFSWHCWTQGHARLTENHNFPLTADFAHPFLASVRADVTWRARHAADSCINSHAVWMGWNHSILCCHVCSSNTEAWRGYGCCRWCWQWGMLIHCNRLWGLCYLSCRGSLYIIAVYVGMYVCVCVKLQSE